MRLTRMREMFAEQSGILVLRVNRSKVNQKPQLHSERGTFPSFSVFYFIAPGTISEGGIFFVVVEFA